MSGGEEERLSWFGYVFATVFLVIGAVVFLWTTQLERLQWPRMHTEALRTHLTLTALQVLRTAVAGVAWEFGGGWLGVAVAVTLMWRVFNTSMEWWVRWERGV